MWSVMLGPDNQSIPDENWDDFRNRGLIYVWDVYCEKISDPNFPRYRVWLKRGSGSSKNNMLPVGETIFLDGWNAFGAHGFMPIDGFATRRAAITYMLRARGFQKSRR